MEVNDTFLYDLRRLSQDAGNLWDAYHDFNVSYYTVSGKSIDIDIDAMVVKWLNNESK